MQVLTDSLAFLLINKLPVSLGINIQDFAIVSEGVYKAVLFVILSFLIASAFFKFQKKNLFMPILIGLVFFSVMAILTKYALFEYFTTVFTYNEVIVPFIFFFLFIFYIFNFYVSEKSLQKKDFFILILFSLLLSTGNYVTFFVPFIFMFILFFDLLLTNVKDKRFIYISLISMFMISRHIIMFFRDSFFNNIFQLNTDFSLFQIQDFLHYFLDIVIIDNLISWFFLITGVSLLFMLKDDKKLNCKFAKFVSYFFVSYIFFLLLTFFLKPNCLLFYLPDHRFGYWFMDSILLLGLNICLLLMIFFVWGYLLFKEIKFLTIFVSFSVVFGFYIHMYFKPIHWIDIVQDNKKFVYVMDKISLFYLKQGKTAILPYSKKQEILIMVPNIYDKTPKKYLYKNYTLDASFYLGYLKKHYKVNVTPGFIFKPQKEAMEEFKANGGKITQQELKELKFSNIK